jgi:Bacteriophage T4-like capsid assembly protein (Gp20).
LVIYRLARAPERRIFYIDVGNLPRGKAEQYMSDIMAKYRNKLVYDASTGQIKDDRKHMSMLEDFWLPRRENGRGTEITTLPGGENLGQIDDIIYFQKRLYRSLNVPVNRLEQESQFSLGRSTEISRDEVKFQKFVDRLRRRFSGVFLGILKKQLLLKGICTEEDWEEWKDSLYIDFVKDNHFTELKEMEILRERIGIMNEITQFVGEYYSKEWVMRNVLRMSDEDIETMKKDIEKEIQSGEIEDKDDEEEQQQTAEPKPAPVQVVPDKPKKRINYV